jgi:putative oxidoreductase
MIVVGGLLVALGIWADLGALLIVAFLVPTAYFMHRHWDIDGPQMRAVQDSQFLKNMSPAGAAVALFALHNIVEDDLLTITRPLFPRLRRQPFGPRHRRIQWTERRR